MKKTLCLCMLAFIISTFSINIKTATLEPFTFDAAALVNTAIHPEATAKLVFDEEFNKPGINPAKWSTQLQWGRANPPELQYYVQNAFLYAGGHSVQMVARKNVATNGKISYTSGVLTTYQHFAFTYGTVQIRVQTPVGQGLWPALWLLDYAGGAQEIDIAEWVGHQPNTAYMTLHYPTSSGNKSLGSHYTGTSFAAAPHIFTLTWQPSAIAWYIDGVKRYQLTQHIPSKPMYLIMNLAVGGDWPGLPNSTTKFPSSLNIDFVRIYQ